MSLTPKRKAKLAALAKKWTEALELVSLASIVEDNSERREVYFESPTGDYYQSPIGFGEGLHRYYPWLKVHTPKDFGLGGYPSEDETAELFFALCAVKEAERILKANEYYTSEIEDTYTLWNKS